MKPSETPESIAWLIRVIEKLPYDERVARKTPGYNSYSTQKDHWLGWLDPTAGTGTYARKAGADRDAQYVYNHIGEPKMLFWLISSAGVRGELLQAAEKAASKEIKLAGKAKAIRRHVPWSVVAAALLQVDSSNMEKLPHNT